jgi:acyl-CoA synthetase (AMP-forming)/AMP-acid ligase II
VPVSLSERAAFARARNLGELLRRAGQRFGEAEAFVEVSSEGPGGRRRLSFGEWDAATDAVACLLADRGLGAGSVLALALPSSIDYAVCYLAAARLGAVTSGINLRLGVSERTAILSRLRPAVVVVADQGSVQGALDRTPGQGEDPEPPGSAGPPGWPGAVVVDRAEVASVAAAAAADASAGRRVPSPPVANVDLGDPVAVVWTSGSTGQPKGALFRHGALAAVAEGSDVLSSTGDRRLSPVPFAHVGVMTRPWDEIVHRVASVICPQPWTAAAAIELMATERVTVGQGVPTQWALVLAHPDVAGRDWSSLRIVGTGGSRVPPELVRDLRERFGCPVVVRYTSTETSLGTGTGLDDPVEVVATTVGRPVPGVELAVVDDASRPVPTGTIGRVRLRSPAVMAGYVASGTDLDVEATAAVLDAEGWVTTGDLGWVGADGNLRLVGRVGDGYIRGGYNVYPSEVEDVLGEHPAVAQVAVVGAPDPVLGEIGVAFVVPASGGPAPDLASLRQHCLARLADYKAPDRLEVVDTLPVTAMGKIDRRTLAVQARGGP